MPAGKRETQDGKTRVPGKNVPQFSMNSLSCGKVPVKTGESYFSERMDAFRTK